MGTSIMVKNNLYQFVAAEWQSSTVLGAIATFQILVRATLWQNNVLDPEMERIIAEAKMTRWSNQN